MRRIAALFAALAGLLAAPALAQEQTIWSCRDRDGRTHVTNLKEDTAGKDCKVVQQQRVTVVPAGPSSGSSGAQRPRETPAARASAKDRQRQILQSELSSEEEALARAREKLAEQEGQRLGGEQNYARVLERLQPYKDSVEVHQKNVDALKRELNNLYK